MRQARAVCLGRQAATVLATVSALAGAVRSEPTESWSFTAFVAVKTDDLCEAAIRLWGAEYLASTWSAWVKATNGVSAGGH